MFCMKLFTLLSYISFIICEGNPKWRDPSAFERHRTQNKLHNDVGSGENPDYIEPIEPFQFQSTSSHSTAAPKELSAEVAALMYKKFVKFIFNRKKLMKDELTNHYIRDIQFQISGEQLDRLESTSNIRDIDGLISDIIAQSGDSTFKNIAMTEFSYHLSNLAFYLQTKNAMYVWAAVCFCLFIWFISRYSKKGIIASALLAIFVVSYAITFMQCNEKKATDKLIKLMQHDGKHSCSGEKVNTGILHLLKSKIFSDQDNECYVKMREIYASELDICSPAEALVIMIAQLNVKYFEEFGHQLIKMFKSLTASSGYFQTVMIGGIILFLLSILLKTLIKSLFKYGFPVHSIIASNNVPSNQINNEKHEKLTEDVEKLQNKCDSLTKKIKRRKDSQTKIIIIEKAYDRVEEIRKLAIDKGAIGDGVINESSDDFSDCSEVDDTENIIEPKLTECEKKVKEMPSSWKGPYLPK